MKIVWSPLAVERASEIVGYIAQDRPLAAEKWIQTVFSKIEQLRMNPEMGRIVPEINDRLFLDGTDKPTVLNLDLRPLLWCPAASEDCRLYPPIAP